MREAVIRRLRELEQQRQQVAELEQALAQLSPVERLLLQKLVVDWERGNMTLLSQTLDLEPVSIYRRKRLALDKLTEILYPKGKR